MPFVLSIGKTSGVIDKKWLIYCKIYFTGWLEKYKKDKRFCEDAYTQWYVTKQNTKCFVVFFLK